MAFVNRAQRKTDFLQPNHATGPGSYQLNIQKVNKAPRVFVPFGSTLNRNKWNDNWNIVTPGPGSYNIIDNKSGQKIVISGQIQDIKILEISRPHPVFKSSTDRFTVLKEENIQPGPAHYNITQPQIQRFKVFTTDSTSNKPKIIEHLININKYQSIPSIPSNIHAYGYNQNEKNELQLNEPPIQVYKGEKNDCIGPGHYNLVKKQKISGESCWSKTKEKRMKQNKINENVGPGCYDVKTMQSLYTYKPSSNFASTTMRTGLQRKSALAEHQPTKKGRDKTIQNYSNNKSGGQANSRVYSQKNQPQTLINDDSEDEYEYIEDTSPGPGAYLEISQTKKYNKTSTSKTPSFGVGTKRFDHSLVKTTSAVGPGAYNFDINNNNFQKKVKQYTPLKSVAKLPIINSSEKIDEPGPGSYEPRNTMQDHLINKIQKGYRGKFGSTEERGKDQEEQDIPGPGQYDPHPMKQQKDGLSSFKSCTQRKTLQNKNGGPAPGMYNTAMNDIASRIIKQQEDDPDLIIKKPGFGIGQKRFQETVVKEQEHEDDDDIIKQIHDKYQEEKKNRLLKHSANFKSMEPRLKGIRKEGPGPGAYYDGEEDHWNKRTYNILFADI